MIITLKDKDSVWIGVSIDYDYGEIHKDDVIHEDNLKMWRAPDASDCIIASYQANGIDIDALRYKKNLGFSVPLTQKNLITKVIPKLKKVFEETDMLDENESWQTLVIAKGDKAFEISPKFLCNEVEDFQITGNTRRGYVAWGSMAINKDITPVDRIAEAFRAIENVKYEMQFPVVIMNTKNKERVVLYN